MLFNLSNPAIPGNYTEQTKRLGEFLVAYEMGSLKLRDPTGGLLQQEWKLESDGANIYISSPTLSPTFLFSDNFITEIDLAFDQNMFPFVCYVCLGGSKYFWFNPILGRFEIVTMAEPILSPRCTLVDKRQFDISSSDVVFAYVDELTNVLCYRLQSDRYGVIYPLTQLDYGMRLRSIGFADTNRLQFTLDDLTPTLSLNLHKGLANYTRPISIKGEYIT